MSKTLTITLYMSEMLYDFKNKAFLTGRSRKADGKDAEFASNMQASDDDTDQNQALRSIQNAYGQLLVELSEGFINVADSTDSNELLDNADITITMTMPSNYNFGIRNAVTAAIHDYIINKALMDWFLIVNKEDAKDYSDLAAISLQNLHNAFNRRERPSRTKPSAATRPAESTTPNTDSGDTNTDTTNKTDTTE